MEIVQELQTRDSVMEKAAAFFGFNQPNATDVIHRENYATDAEYAFALAKMEKDMDTPEYQRAIRKAKVEAKKKADEEEQKARRKEYEEIRKSVHLDSVEQSQVEDEARRRAAADFRDGTISASEISKRALEHLGQLEKEALDKKANNMHFNSLIRRERERNIVRDTE